MPPFMIALMPVASARGLTEMDCPKAIVATAFTDTLRGVSGRAEMIHRDDLVVGPQGAFPAAK